jgi:hypothetical protein
MRSLAQLRLTMTACGAASVALAAVQCALLPVHVPLENLHLAWTLTRILIQL